MPIRDAIHTKGNGCIIDFEINPGCGKLVVPSGYNIWRKRVEGKLTEPAQKGKANDQLIQRLGHIFQINSSSVTIVSGAKTTKKSVHLENVDPKTAEDILEQFL
jgi:hypothetical protein